MGWGASGEHNEYMNADPLLNQRVSDEQRDRAVDYLQQAYAAGAIEPDMFEERLGEALSANTRAELNRSLREVARVAAPMLPKRAPMAAHPAAGRAENVGAGLVHLSGLPTVFIVPAIVKAASTPGSRIWWEAGRAMSFQLTSMIVGVVMITLAGFTGIGGGFVALAYIFYVVLSLIFSARAFSGEVSTGPLAEALPFKPKDPRTRRQLER